VLREAEHLVNLVIAGTRTVENAYDEAMRRKADGNSEEARVAARGA
jgi:hypothetical protein